MSYRLQHNQSGNPEDDFTPFESTSYYPTKSLKRYNKRKSLFFRNMASKSRIKPEDMNSAEKLNNFLTSSLGIKGIPQASWQFASLQPKPSIYNLNLDQEQKVLHRFTKPKFNSTHRKIIMNSNNMGGSRKDWSIVDDEEAEEATVQRIRNNVFVPRVKRIDYIQTYSQVRDRYQRSIQEMSKSAQKKEKELKNQHLPNLTEISHLEELQKFKNCLLLYDTQHKYRRILPKMKLVDEQPVQKQSLTLKKKKKRNFSISDKKKIAPWNHNFHEQFQHFPK